MTKHGQLSAFEKRVCGGDEKEAWLSGTLEIAETLAVKGPFWYSELRARCAVEPVHANWWGSVTKKMRAAGFYMTGYFRRSRTASRKDEIEFEWHKQQRGSEWEPQHTIQMK